MRELESALYREKQLRDGGYLNMRGLAGLPPGVTVQDLIERNARIEANAALTINNLAQEVAAAEDKLSVTGLAVANPSVHSAGITAQLQQVAVISDSDTAKSFAVLYAKDKELNAYKTATKNLQMFTQGLSSHTPETLAAQAGRVVQEAQAVLRASSTDRVDSLPDGWEVRFTPKYGLTYYVDHRRKMSTWVHPSLASPDMFIGAAPYSAVQPNLSRLEDVPTTLAAQPVPTLPPSLPTPVNTNETVVDNNSATYNPASTMKKLQSSRARLQQSRGRSPASSSGPPGLNFASPIAVRQPAAARPRPVAAN